MSIKFSYIRWPTCCTLSVVYGHVCVKVMRGGCGVGGGGGGGLFFRAEDGIRDLVRSRGLGDVYKRQVQHSGQAAARRIAHPLDACVPFEYCAN